MKMIALIKIKFIFIFFILPPFIFSQNDLIITENLPFHSEKLNIIFPNRENSIPVTFFNKTTSKIKLGNYGVAKIKKSNPSEGSTNLIISHHSETKFNFSIDFINSSNESARFKGSKKTSTTSKLLMTTDTNTFEATITTNTRVEKIWSFYLQTIGEKIMFNTEIGQLNNRERTIIVIYSNLNNLKNINETNELDEDTIFYEFVENGISLGAFSFDKVNSIWLKPELDAATKLVLCTAMIAINN